MARQSMATTMLYRNGRRYRMDRERHEAINAETGRRCHQILYVIRQWHTDDANPFPPVLGTGSTKREAIAELEGKG